MRPGIIATIRHVGALASETHMHPRSATMCYMEKVGIRELRQNASAGLRRVAAGEVVEGTDRGRALARIVPMHEASRLEQLQAEGRGSGATGDLLGAQAVPRTAGRPLL